MVFVVILLVLVATALGAFGAIVLLDRGRRSLDPAIGIAAAVDTAMAELRRQAGAERDVAVQAALQQSAVMTREQLGSGLATGQRELDAKKELIDGRLEQVRVEMRGELERLGQMVQQLGQRSSEQLVRVEENLRAHGQVTASLASSTASLREALASSKTRGQWGERMAEDVLRLAGLVENVNYRKQTAVEGGRQLPDFTFLLPKGHVLYMDVKFPLTAYLRHLEATTDTERATHRDSFLRDVRLRLRELTSRNYAAAGEGPTVDYVLMFIPNETISGFIHEHDPTLVEQALGQKVVLCSPLTLFAFLGVVRQAFDNFMIEQTSDEMLQLLGTFTKQWGKYIDSMDKVKGRFESVQREFEQLTGPRRRQLERPLLALEALRLERGLAIDGELFDAHVLELEGYRAERGA